MRISKKILRHHHFVEDFSTHTSHSLRAVLECIGVALRGAEISRRSLADSFFLMHAIRRLARKLSQPDSPNLEDQIQLAPVYQKELLTLVRETLDRPTVCLSTWNRRDMVKQDVLFTDATRSGLGYLYVKQGPNIGEHHITAKFAQLHIPLVIHEAEGLAVRWALSQISPHRNLQLFVDNTIVLAAVRRGYGSTPEVNGAALAVCQRLADTTAEWIPSEKTPADGPSRGLVPTITMSPG
jgi:hypothetical protein